MNGIRKVLIFTAKTRVVTMQFKVYNAFNSSVRKSLLNQPKSIMDLISFGVT